MEGLLATQLNSIFFFKIGFALLAGSIIGIERQIRGKPAGIRTSCLICLGTMLFIHISLLVSDSTLDRSRVLAQVITGIGFLGAGVILTKDGLLHGVTSAAVIWVLAGVGATIGFGFYGLGLAIAFVVVTILVGVEYLESVFKVLQRGVHKHIRSKKSHTQIGGGE